MKLVLNTENPSIIQKIKKIFTSEKDFWDELSEPEKQDILKGIEEIENGEKHSYEEVMKSTDNEKEGCFIKKC